VARIIGHTPTMVRIELRVREEDWARFRSQHPSDAYALRAVRLLFEDSLRVALLDGDHCSRHVWERCE